MARTSTSHKIKVQGAGVQVEAVGSGSILPGHLLEYAGSSGKLQQHSEAGAPAFLFADVSPTVDDISNPTTAPIDVPYDDGETVYAVQPIPGDVINAKIASGESVTKGRHYLISNGDGTLASAGTGNVAVGTANVVGIAWQTVNASGGTAARCLVKAV